MIGLSLTSVSRGRKGPVALPNLPLAAGTKLAALGDSLTANGFQGMTGNLAVATVGTGFDPVAYALGQSRNFNYDTWFDATAPNHDLGANWGRGQEGLGENDPSRPGVNSYIAAMLAHRPAIVIYGGGTNTILSGDYGQGLGDPAYTIARIAEGMTALRKAGKITIRSTIPISGVYPVTDPRNLARLAINTWIRTLHDPTAGVYVWDYAPALERGDGSFDAECFQGDMVHFTQYGAWKASLSLRPILDAIVAAGDIYSDIRAGTNLLPNGGMLGALGSKATNMSGSFFGIGNTLGSAAWPGAVPASTVVFSKEVVATGIEEKQVIAVTPNGASGTLVMNMPQSITGLPAVGDWFQAFAAVEIDNPCVTRLDLWGGVAQGSVVRAASGGMQAYSADTVRNNGADWDGLIVGNPASVPAGVTFDRIRSFMTVGWPGSASPFTLRISKWGVFKRPDPRPAWGY